MPNLTLIPDHIERAVGNMLSQFKDLTTAQLETFIKILVAEVQEAEVAAVSLYRDRTLANAVGDSLDKWGALVGQSRGGLSDMVYRRLIGVRLLANRSQGLTNNLLAIIAGVMQPSGTIRITDLYPAAIQVEYSLPSPGDTGLQAVLLDVLLDAKASGVTLDHIAETTQLTGYFGFEEDPDALGFDDGVFATELIP